MVTHLCENFREKLEALAYMETFKVLIVKYEQMNAPIPDELSFTTVETDPTPNKTGAPIVNGQRYQGLREIDPDEEAYFNGEDHDEEEEALSPATSKTVSNGSSPLKPLVDYPDDDDEEDELSAADPIVVTNGTKPKASSEESTTELAPSPSTLRDTKSPPATVAPPPERIAEKRRREDDDEDDELSRLASQAPKRRLSGATAPNNNISGVNASNSIVTGGHTLRRKKGMNVSDNKKKEGKIAIQLAVKAGEGQSGDS
jgi:protein phosphatase-4 regulatory subunit 3